MDNYQKVLKKKDLRVGDTVKVMCEMESHSNGWDNSWVEDMDERVGETLTVTSEDSHNRGLELGSGFKYPPHVLRRIRKGPAHG